jgi:hypothetical protein
VIITDKTGAVIAARPAEIKPDGGRSTLAAYKAKLGG